MTQYVTMDLPIGVSRLNLFCGRFIISLLLLPFVITILVLPTGEGKLIGDHVCQAEIVVPQEEQIWELRNRTIRTYKWCLNVPPRCAEYSTKLVNESKIVVVNVTKQSETCCNGFKEYKNYCVSECADCENGVCIKGFCVCQSGWTGPECNSRITTTETTPSTTTSTPSLVWTSATSAETTTKKPENPSPSSTANPEILYNPTGPKLDELEGSGSKVNWPKLVAESTLTFDADLENASRASEALLVDQSNHFDPEEYSDDNYEEFGSSFESIEGDEKLVQSDVDLFKEGLLDAGALTSPKPPTTITKPTLSKNLADNENSILKEHLLKDLDDFISERHEERSSIEEMRQNTKLSIESTAGKNLIYSICAAALTTFLILVAAVTMYAMKNSRKKLENGKNKRDGVAVYTTSIFHSPLPDPPTPSCENPIYPMVVPSESIGRESMEIQEFNVVFHKPVRNPKLDTKFYLYDHPPSTGSYRASSEVDTLSQYNFSQRSHQQPNGDVITEPVYDEIPSKDPFAVTYMNAPSGDKDATYANSSKTRREGAADGSSLYMNTVCRTKF